MRPIETIRCAAIKRSDGIILAGRNHAFIIQHSPENTCKNNSQQGFITSRARFVSRVEAGEIAYAVGQITNPTTMLFSEDITQDNPWAGEMVAELQSQLAAEKEKAQAFGNVLAVIHGDGGHYISEHGPHKASRDAIQIIVKLRQELLTLKENKQ